MDLYSTLVGLNTKFDWCFYFRTSKTPRTNSVALTREEVTLTTSDPIGPNGIERYPVGTQTPVRYVSQTVRNPPDGLLVIMAALRSNAPMMKEAIRRTKPRMAFRLKVKAFRMDCFHSAMFKPFIVDHLKRRP
jgi:hypothetical protein